MNTTTRVEGMGVGGRERERCILINTKRKK